MNVTPVLYYDGNCGFCRRLVGWVRRRGGDHLHYIHRADASSQVKEVSLNAVLLVDSQGETYSGAKAFYKTWSLLGHPRWWAFYQSSRPFSLLSDGFYRLISLCRPFLSVLLDVFLGPPPEDL